MNHVEISGVIGSTPKVKSLGECITASCALDIGNRSFIQIHALGDAARQLAQLHSGKSVRVTGKLAFSPNGTLQVVAKQFGLLEVQYTKVETFAAKSA